MQKNLFVKGYLFNTPVLNNLCLQNGLLFTKHNEFNRLEFPFLLRYNISEKWNLLFGAQLSTITNYNNVLSTKYSAFKNLDASIYLGSEYKFSDLVSGQFSLQYSILNIEDKAFKNFRIDTNPLKFNVGVKF
ncbi:hypothetical protein [uncultured Algibacter sp.]|uniref:hypothetical protein n=1 Tax=uncultured Algibacter sp. TaxID=298659 RepID=UPI00261851F2|nr:hypothetical protein [uncultured Algibacter sp.]